MRCPHCGYNSFAHLQHCKKCGHELKRRSVETENLESNAVTGSATVDDEDISSILLAEATDVPAETDAKASDDRQQSMKVDEVEEAQKEPEPALFAGFDFTTTPESEDETFLAANPATEPFPLSETSPPQDRALIGRRFLASVLDIAVILGVWLMFYAWGHSLLWEGDSAFFAPLLHSPRVRGGFYLLLILIALAYFILFHYINGQTPGKVLAGIKVVSCDAEPLTLIQVLLRTCGGFVSALCLGVGYIAIWWAQDARGWNDKFADSRVEFISAGDTSRPEYE